MIGPATRDSRRKGSMLWAVAPLLIVCAGISSTAEAATASTSFSELCKASGVTKCVGFDSSSEISPYVTSGNGAAPALDTSVKASGGGSMKMTYVSGGTQATGLWKGDIGGPFAPGTHFYFAFKQRFSSSVLSAGGQSNGWKQFILYTAPNDPSCNQTQIVTEKHNQGFPIAYSKCGALPFREDMSDGDKRFQFGPGLDCRYRSTSGCWDYVADKWITFYYDVDFRPYGSASRVKAWVAVDGGKFQQWMDFAPSFGMEGSGRFETIQLTMYTTGGANGSGNAWYDDFIVSRQPIYDVNATEEVRPSTPTGVAVQ